MIRLQDTVDNDRFKNGLMKSGSVGSLSMNTKTKFVSLILIRCWCLVIGFLMCHVPAVAEPLLGTMTTMNPRALGLSGAMVASPAGTSAVYLNPSTISMTPIYHFEGMYQYTAKENLHMGGVAVADSVTSNLVGAGVSFNYVGKDEPRSKHQSYDVRLALSGAIGQYFYLGATGRYLRVAQNLETNKWGPSGVAALSASGSQQVDGFTFDAGAAVKAGSIITLGVTGYNLTHTESVFAPMILGAGVSVSLFEMLRIEVDSVTDFTSYETVQQEIKLGAEVFIGGQVAIRGGYRFNVYHKFNAVSVGLGYIHSRFSLDAGFMNEFRDDGRLAFGLGFKYFAN